MVEDLKKIQSDIGLDKEIEPQKNYVREKFIDQRIEELLTEDNFFFFKIFQNHEKDYKLKNEIEKREIERLIKAHYTYSKVYIK